MTRILKNIMRILYANNNYSKNGIDNGGYYVAILGASFFIFLTGFLLLVILSCISPDFYKLVYGRSVKINSLIISVLYLIISSLLIRLKIRVTDISDSSFTREQVNRGINYFIVYTLFVGIASGLLIMKFLSN